MDTRTEEQLARDVHLVAAPFRIAADILKALAFLLVSTVLIVVSGVKYIFTGEPLLAPEEWYPIKLMFLIFSPFLIPFTIFFVRNMCRLHKDKKRAAELESAQVRAKQEKDKQDALDKMYNHTGAPEKCVWCNHYGWGPVSLTYIRNDEDRAEMARSHAPDCPWFTTEGKPYLVIPKEQYNRIIGIA